MDRGRYSPETFSTNESDELKNWLDNVVLETDGSMTLDTGASFTIGTTQWSSGDGIDSSLIDHDATTNFVANEHIDWRSTSSNFSTSGRVEGGAATFTGLTLNGNIDINGDRTLKFGDVSTQDALTLRGEGAIRTNILIDSEGGHNNSLLIDMGENFTTLQSDDPLTIRCESGDFSLRDGTPDIVTVAELKSAYTHSQIAGGNSVHVSTTENTNWDTAYTHANGSTGADHTWLDQSVISGATPTFGADNFSDGGGNAIVTTTQETNWDNHIANNSQAHTDYLLNTTDENTGTITAAGLDTDVFTSADKRQPFFLTATVTSGADVTIYNSNAPIAFDIVFASWLGTVTGSGGLVDLKDGAAGNVILSLSGGEDVVDITSSTAIDVTYNSVAVNGSLVVEPQGKTPDMSGVMVITCVPT
jgi:hypothetical protein